MSKSWREPASGTAKQSPSDVTNLLRDGCPPAEPSAARRLRNAAAIHCSFARPLSASRAGDTIDSFSYFVVFYSLILGLALTELLSGFARLVRARALRKLEPQTALVALVTLIFLCATWLDAWDSLKSIRLNLADLWAPVLMVICYYLAAAVIFPHDEADHERLADYYRERRPFIMTMLFAAGLLEIFVTRSTLLAALERNPPSFWLWYLPFNIAIAGSLLALIFVRSRTANLVLLVLLILLVIIPYWSNGGLGRIVTHAFGY